MARSSVSFVLGTQTLGQAAAGNDFISGMPFVGTAPGSFATNAYQAVYSLQDAEDKGITLDYSDETLSKGIVTLVRGATGDTVKITMTEPNPVTPANPTGTTTYTLCEYTQVAGDSTDTLLATSVAAAINANSYLTSAGGSLTGYTCTSALGVLTISARQGTGIALNGTTAIATTVTGTLTATITQNMGTDSGGATAGVYSKKAVWHYEVSEFFRANATGVLWVGFFSSYAAGNITTLSNAANGTIKQYGVLDITVTSASAFTTNMTALQAQAVSLFGAYNPAGSIQYAPNVKAVSDLSTLENQQTKTNYYISPVIMQDGGAVGAQLYINSGISIPNIGCTLGTTSKAKVNQDIGEIGAFNITDDVEMAIPAFSNGSKVSAIASNLLDQLDAYRYIFATNVPNITGTYIVNDWTCIAQTSPYYRISRNRVMSKAIRLIYAAVMPLLKSQIPLNTDGTIDDVTIQRFDSVVIPVGAQMKDAGEISNMSVTISNTQNVISAGKLVIGVKIQPTITADFIEVDMSFVAKL